MAERCSFSYDVVVVICNSGFGHTKRVLYVLERLLAIRSDLKVTIIVDRSKLESFPYIYHKLLSKNAIDVKHIDADVLTYEKKATRLHQERLKHADLVWSDNLSFPLLLNDNVLITGSFLWLDELGGKFAAEESALVKKMRPTMIGCEYFATASVRQKTHFVGVGIYDYSGQDSSQYGNGDKVLIAVGGTGRLENQVEQAIVQMAARYSGTVPLCVDQKIFPETLPRGEIFREEFSRRGITGYASAVVRPGLGTVCDLWSSGTVIYPIIESESNEMTANRAKIISMQGGVGACSTLEDSLRGAIVLAKRNSLREPVVRKLRQLDYSGIEKTAELISGLISEQCGDGSSFDGSRIS